MGVCVFQVFIRKMLLLPGFRKLRFIVSYRPSFGNGKRGPTFCRHLSDINDLPYMVGIMGQLPVNGLHDGMSLLADINDVFQVFRLQIAKRLEKDQPALFPLLQHGCSSC